MLEKRKNTEKNTVGSRKDRSKISSNQVNDK